MVSNLINSNLQMQQLAAKAVIEARDKFGVSLDFSENSLNQLDSLLQQAHERYKQLSFNDKPPNIPIENTIRVWGSYLGEVIRRRLGGDWIVEQKIVFLHIGGRRLDPLGQVRSRIVNGPQYNSKNYLQGLMSGNQEILKEPPKGPMFNKNETQSLLNKKGTINRWSIYITALIGAIILLCMCFIGVWILFRQGTLAIPSERNSSTLQVSNPEIIIDVPSFFEKSLSEIRSRYRIASYEDLHPLVGYEDILPSGRFSEGYSDGNYSFYVFYDESQHAVGFQIYDGFESLQLKVNDWKKISQMLNLNVNRSPDLINDYRAMWNSVSGYHLEIIRNISGEFVFAVIVVNSR
jgi:hypothetical protein